jgi:quercetin dioxygenase-like cupin family protein
MRKPASLSIATMAMALSVAFIGPGVLTSAPAYSVTQPAAGAPQLKTVNATAQVWVERLFTMIAQQNERGLEGLLSTALIVQAPNGQTMTKPQFLNDLPAVGPFEIRNVQATQARGTVIVRYDAVVTPRVGVKAVPLEPAPHLSTFLWNGKRWKLTSHAMFAPGTAPVSPGVQPLLTRVTQTILEQPIAYPDSKPEISAAIITLNEGSQTGWHRHDAPMFAYVLTGSVTVTYDGNIVKTYSAGEALMEAVGTRHNGMSTGPGPVQILVVNFGAEGVANTVVL